MAIAIERIERLIARRKQQTEVPLIETRVISVAGRSFRERLLDMWGVFRLTHDRYVNFDIPGESSGYGIVVGRNYLKGVVTLERDVDEGERRINFGGRFLTTSSIFY